MRESVQYRSYRASATKPLSPCLKAGHKSRDQDQQSPLKINTLPRHDKLNSPYENKRHQRELEPESSMFETRDDPLDDPRDKLKHPRKNNRIATRRESAEMETKETTSMNNQSKSLVVAKFEDAPRHSRFRKWGSLGRRKTVAKKSKPDIQMGGLKNDDSTSKIENRKWGFLGRRKAKLSFCFFPKFFRRSRGNNNE